MQQGLRPESGVLDLARDIGAVPATIAQGFLALLPGAVVLVREARGSPATQRGGRHAGSCRFAANGQGAGHARGSWENPPGEDRSERTIYGHFTAEHFCMASRPKTSDCLRLADGCH